MTDDNYTRASWLHNTNIYEVNLRQYTPEGTLAAFAKQLPRLREMGVEVLWFMPIHPIGEKNRKGSLGSYYSVKDFKAVNPEFGTLKDFRNMVKQAHDLGMKVIIDWVANHTAWDNVWTKNHPEYYKRDSAGQFQSPWDWSDVIQIDHTNEAQQNAMIDAMQFWIRECDIDGFRADLAHLTPLPFWKKARRNIEPMKAELFWLAESEEVNYHEVFDASYTWEWMHKSEDFVKGKANRNDIDSLLKAYNTKFPKSAYRMYFTSNHDENSWNGTEFEKYGEAAKAMAVFSCTWNGIPMIYSGQELPNDRRLKFFEKDPIKWLGTRYKFEDFYKKLLHLHKTHPALRACDDAVVTRIIPVQDHPDCLVFNRTNGNRQIWVFLNFKNTAASFKLEDEDIEARRYKDVLNDREIGLDDARKISLPAFGYLMLDKLN